MLAGLDRMERAVTEDVVYSGAAAMARVLYAEVRQNTAGAPVGIHTGNLHGAIYWAKAKDASTATRAVYEVSWNKSKAPHGHLIEFGHWRVNFVFRGKDGSLIATKRRLPQPVWVPAYPFMRPAMSKMDDAIRAGLARMRERFGEAMAQGTKAEAETA